IQDSRNDTIGGATAGSGNVIAYNGGSGIAVTDQYPVPQSTGDAIRGHTIHSNGGPGIHPGDDGVTVNAPSDADVGPNTLQNFPVFTSVSYGAITRVAGTLNSMPSTTFDVELFANAVQGPTGERFLGSRTVTTDSAGNTTFAFTLAA